jgi:hypothetical protein
METRISQEDHVFLDLANNYKPLPISQREERLRERYPLSVDISSLWRGGGDLTNYDSKKAWISLLIVVSSPDYMMIWFYH